MDEFEEVEIDQEDNQEEVEQVEEDYDAEFDFGEDNELEKDEEGSVEQDKAINENNAEQLQLDVQERMQAEYERGLREAKLQFYQGTKNIYTDKEIKDDIDYQIFEQMKKLESLGKDPITDFAEYYAEQLRQTEQETQSMIAKQNEQQKEIQWFIKDNSDISISELVKDPDFLMVAESGVGIKKTYELYKQIKNRQQEQQRLAEVKTVAKTKATPGALGGKVVLKSTNEEAIYEKMLRGEFD